MRIIDWILLILTNCSFRDRSGQYSAEVGSSLVNPRFFFGGYERFCFLLKLVKIDPYEYSSCTHGSV
jgi:hypothetical protein